MSDRNAPKIKTLQSWKSEFNWLKYQFAVQCLQEMERKNNISEEFLRHIYQGFNKLSKIDYS